MNRLQIKPPHFSDSDLQAITQATAICNSAVPRLIRLLQEIRNWRYDQIIQLSPVEVAELKRLANHLDSEISVMLYYFLIQSGVVQSGNWIDLEAITNQCRLSLNLGEEL